MYAYNTPIQKEQMKRGRAVDHCGNEVVVPVAKTNVIGQLASKPFRGRNKEIGRAHV